MSNILKLKHKYPWLFPTKPLSVDIIFDFHVSKEDDERERMATQDTIKTANSLLDALTSAGHSAKLVPLNQKNYKTTLPTLTSDVVFNQVEDSDLGASVLKILEKLGKPVTGVDSHGFDLSWDKTAIKKLLLKANVPTPAYFTVKEGQTPRLPKNLTFPLFVKAADDHGSLSINKNSFVDNKQALLSQISWIHATIGGSALVEQYIDGRELYVTLLGNGKQSVVLPPEENGFDDSFANRPKVITYDAKWKKGSPDYQGSDYVICPTKLTSKEIKAIETAVKRANIALGSRDYVRFDIRLYDNIPYIIDYNANPGIGPDDPSSLPAKVFGLNYPNFISAIVTLAYNRSK